MMKRSQALFVAALALSALMSAPSASAASPGVFDELQQNVWYMHTEDKDVQLYVTSLGKGPMVVCLHGGPGNDFNYLVPAVAPLSDKYQFVLFDQRGSLLSPVPPDKVKDLNLQVLVEDLDALRQKLGQDKLVLFGHSFGSYLAMAYYQAHPDHVAGLVLAGSLPPQYASLKDYLGGMRVRFKTLRDRPEVMQALQAAGVPKDTSWDQLTEKQRNARFRIDMASLDLYHVDRWRQVEGGGIYYNSAVDDAVGDSFPMQFSILATLKAHPVPITVLQGDSDYTDPAAATWQAEQSAYPQIKVLVLSKASHYSWIDAPDEFTKDFSAGLDRATAGR